MIKDVGAEDFESVLQGGRPVLVDFWAEWCVPCKALAPTLEKLSQQFTGKVDVVKVNVDQHPSIRDRFSVRGIPTLLLLKEGRETGRSVGSRSLAQLTTFLDGHLGTQTAAVPAAPVVLSTFGGNAVMKAECTSRLGAYLEKRRVALDEPMWEGQIHSAFGYVANTADPDEIARYFGIPEAIVVLVETLSSYYGMHLKVAEYVASWLDAVPVGANLQGLIPAFVMRVLEGDFVRALVDPYPALNDIRLQLIGMHNPSTGKLAYQDPRWSEVREACKAIESSSDDYACVESARLLGAAAWAWDEDSSAIRTIVQRITMYTWRKVQHDINWTTDEQKRFDSLAHQIMTDAKAKGEDWPRGDAMAEQIAKIDAELVKRFLHQYEQGRGALMSEGTELSERLLDLTARYTEETDGGTHEA